MTKELMFEFIKSKGDCCVPSYIDCPACPVTVDWCALACDDYAAYYCSQEVYDKINSAEYKKERYERALSMLTKEGYLKYYYDC